MDVSRGGIYIFRNCDMFSVVNVYRDHLKSTSCLVQPIGMHSGEVMYFGCFCFRGDLGFLIVMISACVS